MEKFFWRLKFSFLAIRYNKAYTSPFKNIQTTPMPLSVLCSLPYLWIAVSPWQN